jgi:hypothetical protein
MTEHLRRDAGLTPEESSAVDPNRPERLERPVDRPMESDAGSRPIVTPPPADFHAVSGSAQTATGAATATARAAEEERTPLFAGNEANTFRARWDSIQVGFVDEPRKAVQEADALVSDTIKRLSDVFASERQKLEQQWDRNENVSTEDFRIALRRYRSFFSRLLSI